MLVTGWLILDALKDRGPSTVDSLALKVKALRSFETLGITHSATQIHIPEDLNSQQHCCENFISCSISVFCDGGSVWEDCSLVGGIHHLLYKCLLRCVCMLNLMCLLFTLRDVSSFSLHAGGTDGRISIFSSS
jgi:hypothetical protein